MINQARQDYDNAIDAINNSNMSDDEKEAARQAAYENYFNIQQAENGKKQAEVSGSGSTSLSSGTSSSVGLNQFFDGCFNILSAPILLPYLLIKETSKFSYQTLSTISKGLGKFLRNTASFILGNKAPEVKKEFKNEQEKIDNAKAIIKHYQNERSPFKKYATYTLCAGTMLASTYGAITSENESDLKYALVPLVCALWLTAYTARNKTHNQNKCLKKVGKIFPETINKSKDSEMTAMQVLQYIIIFSSLSSMATEFNKMNTYLQHFPPESHARYCQQIGKKEAPQHINSLLWISLYGLGGRLFLNAIQKEKLEKRKFSMQCSKRKDLFKDYIKE